MTQNGNAFQAFVEDTLSFLHGRQVIDYFQESLPAAADGRLAEIVDRFLSASAAEREQMQQALASDHRSLFGIFGHRAATLAMRQESREWLRRGLAATAVANYVIPQKRNVDVALAVHHHVARRLGVNTVDLFDEIADVAGVEMAGILRRYGRRSDVRLARYGWRELRTPDGVKYKFDWR